MQNQITEILLAKYNQEPCRQHKLLLQIDPSGELLEAIAELARDQRNNAPLVKPEGESVEVEGWQV